MWPWRAEIGSTNGNTAGWYQDPTGQGDARYRNGVAWTQPVDRAGTTVNIAIDPTQAKQPWRSRTGQVSGGRRCAGSSIRSERP
jgi:hypothetical protein